MDNEIHISVVIPVYNRKELIKETLDSVFAQTYIKWECIIVDDQSTDNTYKIISEYVTRDERFKLYKRDGAPKGASTCRNIGVKNSKGSYIIFLDSDDLLSKDCLAYRLEKINVHPNNSVWIFNTGVFNKFIGDTNIRWNKLNTEDDDIVRFLNQDMPWHTSGAIWKKETVLEFNENAKSFQDWEIHIRFLARQKEYYKDKEDKLTVYYRKDEAQHTISADTYKPEQLINRIEVIIDTCKVLNLETERYDSDIIKLIFRTTRLLKEQGLKKDAFYYWNLSKRHFEISKIDSLILTTFLLLINKKNTRTLEFFVFRILRKGYLLRFKTTFLS